MFYFLNSPTLYMESLEFHGPKINEDNEDLEKLIKELRNKDLKEK